MTENKVEPEKQASKKRKSFVSTITENLLPFSLLVSILVGLPTIYKLYISNKNQSPPTPDQRLVPIDILVDSKEISNSLGMKMMRIPAGSFMMGSPKNEDGRREDEGPVHRVTISKPFYLGAYEVTQGEYEAVMGVNPSFHSWGSERLPVEEVSWNNAMEFCRKLTAVEHRAGRLREGWRYSLPTEAQWEYACRAGTQTAYYWDWGDKWDNAFGWSMGNTGDMTHEVGGKLPNAWGLFDMSGNVGEWCLDWYDSKYPDEDRTDPQGPENGKYRIWRGGSWWFIDDKRCRSASRLRCAPDVHYNHLGFRLLFSKFSGAD